MAGLLAHQGLVHDLQELAVIRHRRQALLELDDGAVQVALLDQPQAALVVMVGRLEFGLAQARSQLDVVRFAGGCLAVHQYRLDPFIPRGVIIGALDRAGAVREQEHQQRRKGRTRCAVGTW